MCHILGQIGVENTEFGLWNPRDHSKKSLIDFMRKYTSEIEDSYGLDFSIEYDDSVDNENKEAIPLGTRFEVRYIGHRSVVNHNENSTPSGAKYQFTRMSWLEVDETDWEHKYFDKVESSVKMESEPQWEVRKISPLGQLTNYFVEKIKKIVSKKPLNLWNVKHVHEDRTILLREYGIRSISELLRTPQLVIKDILGIDAPTVAEMYDDARR